MKILITGSNGFIGKNLGKFLSKDYEVFGYEWNLEQFPDVTGLDWVIHLGAISSTTETDVDKVMLQNYEFSKWLFLECNSKKVNFQYASSASVYGSTTHFTENGPLQPKSPYSWSKYLFDRWVTHQNKQIITQGFRYFNVYGPNEAHKGNQASVFTKFVNQAQTLKRIQLFENSENFKRDFICVKDICNIHKLFLDTEQNGIWNLGTGKCWSFKEIAQAIAEKMNVPIEYIPMPAELNGQYQTYTCANISELQSVVGNYQFINPFDYVSSL